MEEFLANINGPIGQMSVGNFILLMVSLLLLFKIEVSHKMQTTVDTKYYTPSLEEFHIGFEYEFKLYKDGITEWEPTTLNVCAVLKDWVADNPFAQPLSDFRVKYLDKEDIESLGFNSMPKGADKYFARNCRPDSIDEVIWSKEIINAEFSSVHLTIWNNNIILLFGVIHMSFSALPIFNGTCKNKSKLKQLLKDIGIL